MPVSPEYRRAVLRGALLLDTMQPNGGDPDSPDYRCDAYLAQVHDVVRARVLFAGTDAMRKAAEKYLPKNEKETAEDYQARLNTARLYNAFRRTVRAYVGMVTRKAPRLVEPNSEIEGHAENIDLAGRDLPTFVADVLEDAMQVGHAYVLVDYPVTVVEDPDAGPRPMNLLEERQAGVRPYWVHIRKEQVINWRYEMRAGRPFLTLVVIEETVDEDEGVYGSKEVPQVRVLRPGSVEVYREDGEDWTLHEAATTTLDYIPIVPVYTNRTGFMTSEPPLQDLIHENIGHWQEASQHRSAINRNRITMPFFRGFDPEQAIWGSNYSLTTENPEAGAQILEVTGAAMEASREELQAIEMRMATLGLSMLVRESRSAETARAKMIDKSESDSALSRVAQGLEDALELALWFHADWMGVPREQAGSVEVNTDYTGIEMDPQMVRSLLEAVDRKALRKIDFLAALRRGEILDDTLDLDELVAELDAEEERGLEVMMRIAAQSRDPEEQEDGELEEAA